MKSDSDSLIRNMHTSSLLEVILWGSGSAPPVELLHLHGAVQRSLYNGPSSGISFILLKLDLN